MMDFYLDDMTFVCLSFDEGYILDKNLKNYDMPDFIKELDKLILYTTDVHLKQELKNLLRKIQQLTPMEFEMLCEEMKADSAAFPPGYPLPFLYQA